MEPAQAPPERLHERARRGDDVHRVVGGLLYLGGMLIMLWNTWMTVARGRAVRVPIPAVVAHA